MYENVVVHAQGFSEYLSSNTAVIHDVLRKYESKEVVDDEIRRSIETLQNLSLIERYFVTHTEKTAVFLPLNLPLYSLVLFAVLPAYQSEYVVVRPPQLMQGLFGKLLGKLPIKEYFPNISVFDGMRESFLSAHCKDASVVIFTGSYKNFLRIRKACTKDILVLYNGVGHNPIVVTPSADIALAVKKTLQVKLFNNGQDCAGPDMILVHGAIADRYLEALCSEIAKVRCDIDYEDKDTLVGPLFETASLLNATRLVSEMRKKGAQIIHGGQFDLNHNVVYPCVVKMHLRQMQNYDELYSPIFAVAEYKYDQELALYFEDAGGRYQAEEMYISLFGESNYVATVRGSIILKNCVVHDVERGTQEYGGYGYGASSVSYRGFTMPKPILIPREIHTFLSPQGREMLSASRGKPHYSEYDLVADNFREVTQRIFANQLAFACIFGSFARKQDKRSSDIDTLVCVHEKDIESVRQYLTWLFDIHEKLGRIPDFKYPAEVVTLAELQNAFFQLPTLNLTVNPNEASKYDFMVWCHALAQPLIGVVHPENIPDAWQNLFSAHSQRILRTFLKDMERVIISGSKIEALPRELQEAPTSEPGLSQYIENLSQRGLLAILKAIPFKENPAHTKTVLELVSGREFIGRSYFSFSDTSHLYHPCFRFGVVANLPVKT